MYSIDLSQRTQKFVDKRDEHEKERIETALKRLEAKPVPSDAKFMGRDRGEKLFRIGDYRALYSINEETKTILIIKIDKRPRVYERR